jgi:hypothetical protein
VDDWEVVKSADAIFQTYDISGGTAHYRTAMVVRRDPERPIRVNGQLPRFGPSS